MIRKIREVILNEEKLGEDVTDAGSKATKYISSITGTDGISVHDANDTSNYVNITSGLINLVTGGTSRLKAYVENNVAKLRIGDASAGHIMIEPNSIDMITGGISRLKAYIENNVAKFRIGDSSAGNILIADEKVAIRDELTELAKFGADGMQVGKDGEQHIAITPSKFEVYDEDENLPFYVQTESTRRTETGQWIAVATAGYTLAWTLVIKGHAVNNIVEVGVSTSSNPSITDSITLNGSTEVTKTVDGVRITLSLTSQNEVYAIYRNTNSSDRFVKFQINQEYRKSTTIIGNRIMRPEYKHVYTTDTTGVCKYAYAYTSGDTVQLYLDVYRGSSVGPNYSIYTGKILSCIPQNQVSLLGLFHASNGQILPCIGYLSSSGDVYVYNCSPYTATIDSSHSVALYGTYILNEGSN